MWHHISVLDVQPNTHDRCIIEEFSWITLVHFLHLPCTECEGHLEAHALPPHSDRCGRVVRTPLERMWILDIAWEDVAWRELCADHTQFNNYIVVISMWTNSHLINVSMLEELKQHDDQNMMRLLRIQYTLMINALIVSAICDTSPHIHNFWCFILVFTPFA
jgi:hypothetical protein